MNLKDLAKNKSKFPSSSIGALPTKTIKEQPNSGLRDKSDLSMSFIVDGKGRSVWKNINSPKKKMGVIARFFLSLFLLILTIGGGIFGYYYYQNYSTLKNTGVENVSLLDPLKYAISAAAPQKIEPLSQLEKTESRTNFLLLGVDARRGFSSYRTDTIILASYSHVTKEVIEISIPRDTKANYLTNSYGKINGVFQLTFNDAKNRKKQTEEEAVKTAYNALANSVYEVTGIKPHYGIMVNFTALKDIVDALGGITVNVDKALYDNLYPNDSDTGTIKINFKVGEQQMNGSKALQYARSRQTTSDYDRARRQQQVVNAIKDKFVKSNMFSDVNAINKTLEAITKNVRFFNVTGETINEVIKGREVLSSLSVANMVVDPNLGSFTGQLLRGGDKQDGAGFVLEPISGKYDDVQTLISLYLDNTYLLTEDASIRTLYTNKIRSKEFNNFNKAVLDKKLPFVGINSIINLSVPKGTTPSPTPTDLLSKKVNVYMREDKSKTLNFFINLLKEQGFEVIVKNELDLPKELEKHFKESNILIEFN